MHRDRDLVDNARWREDATSLSDVMLALHNAVQIVANSRGVSRDPDVLATYRALALSAAAPLVSLSDDGDLSPEDAVYILVWGALFVHGRYVMRLQEIARLKEANGESST